MRLQPAKKRGRSSDYVLLVASLLLGILAVFALRQPVVIKSGDPWPWVLLLAAAGLGGLALRRMDAWLPEASALPVAAGPVPPIRQRQAVVCLGIAGLLTAWVVVRLWPDYHQWSGTPLPWLVSLGLVLFAGFWASPSRSKHNPTAENTRVGEPKPDFQIPRWVEITGFLLITGLAIFLRVYRLNTFPPGIYVDETNGGLDALYLLEGNHVSPFATGWYGTPNGYIYYMAFLIKLFGANYYTLKAISLIPALLTVLAIYPLGRMMFGPVGGLSAMLFLAVSRWHLSMSRFGWNETAVPLFQILATYFLLRGLRERRARDFALGGVITGLMLYIYLSSRLAVATLGLFVVYWILADPEGPRASLKRSLPGLAMFGVATIITFAPLAVTHITDPFTFSNRVGEISIFRDVKQAGSLQPLWLNIQDHLRFFHQVGDHQGKHNLPNEPEADPFTGVLFVIGLSYAAMRLRDRRRGLLWLWLLFGMAGGVLSSHSESPQSYRTLTALPAVVLLAGDTASRILRGTFRLRSSPIRLSIRQLRTDRALKGAGVFLFGLVLVGAAAWESTVFIGKQMNSLQVKAWFNPTENAVAKEVLAGLKANQSIYLTPNFYSFSPLRFLVYGYSKPLTGKNTLDAPPYYLFRPDTDLPIADPGENAVFLLDNDYAAVISYFRSFYPGMQIEQVQLENAIPLYLRVRVPLSDLASVQGLTVRAIGPNGELQSGVVSDVVELPGTPQPSSSEWEAGLRIEHSGEYDFSTGKGIGLAMDGQAWSGSHYLCSGIHPVKITRNSIPSTAPLELRWVPPGGQAAPVPAQNWFRLPLPTQGLTGYYYRGTEWQGEPVCIQPTPFFLLAWPDQEPLSGPFSAKFIGYLRVPTAGSYRFLVHADDGARLTLDGNVVGEGLQPNQINDFEATLDLTAGDHPIEIDYFQAGGGSGLVLKWQPPGSPLSLVPSEALLPERQK